MPKYKSYFKNFSTVIEYILYGHAMWKKFTDI